MSFLSGILGAAGGFLTGGPAGAVIGGLGGFLGGKEQKKQQSKADNASNQSLYLQQQALDREIAKDKKAQADYDANYKPLEDKYLASVKEGVNPNYEQITSDVIGDVNSQFAGSEAARVRQMQRLGVNPNSGRADSLGRNLSLTRTLALSGGINSARRQERQRAEDLTFARTQDAAQMGINKLNSNPSNINSASTALSQTYANQANQAQSNANNAANTWADLGGTVFKAWDQYKNKPAPITPSTGVWF